jgi:hypothetical protein
VNSQEHIFLKLLLTKYQIKTRLIQLFSHCSDLFTSQRTAAINDYGTMGMMPRKYTKNTRLPQIAIFENYIWHDWYKSCIWGFAISNTNSN